MLLVQVMERITKRAVNSERGTYLVPGAKLQVEELMMYRQAVLKRL